MKFKTVKQVMEHYLPEPKPVTGSELAARLLEDFRNNLAKRRQKGD